MTKKEFVDRYGIEKYQRRLEKTRQWRDAHPEEVKQYRDTHKDEIKQSIKQYRDTHKDEIKQSNKRYRDTHKDEIKQSNKRYREAHKEERRKYDKQWRDAHPEEVKQYCKQYNDTHKEERKEYQKTQKGRASYLANAYNQADKERGFDITNNVKTSYIIERIFSSKCIYCGDDNWEHLGCDRIDNTKPHTPDNVVPCCGICNIKRQDRKTVEEMLEYRTTNPRMLRNMNFPIEKTPSGAIKKRVFTVVG